LNIETKVIHKRKQKPENAPTLLNRITKASSLVKNPVLLSLANSVDSLTELNLDLLLASLELWVLPLQVVVLAVVE